MGIIRIEGRYCIGLNVRFEDKDRAKKLGARWNPDRRIWWILADTQDLRPFAEWLPMDVKPAAPKRLRRPKFDPEKIDPERRAFLNGALRTIKDAGG